MKKRTQPTTTECKPAELRFSSVKGLKLTTDFGGGSISTDGGLPLVGEVDRKLKLSTRAADCIADERQCGKVEHRTLTMLRQRLYGLCAGWEDLNDFEQLRDDNLHQRLAGSDHRLASPSTLCRLENKQNREAAWKLNELLVDLFIESFESEPAELILDFEATDNPVHGPQQGRFFHGYYDHYCFLPLYVFCGDQLLCAYLRPSNIDASKHAGAILKLLVTKLRQRWANTHLIIRADSGFCRNRILNWCDRHDVSYIIGLARNQRLQGLGESRQQQAAQAHEHTGQPQRLFGGFEYAAKSWTWLRWVIHKAEHTDKGSNPRFVVTNLVGEDQELYDKIYCARGDMENRIKEQIMLFSERTSTHRWWTNHYRLLLSGLAYTLMEGLRRLALKGTELARAQATTIRSKLIKIGAVITRNTRRIRIHLSHAHPLKELFSQAVKRLVPT